VHEPLLQAFPFPSTLGRGHSTRFLWSVCLFTAQVGSGSSHLYCGVFLPSPLLQAFPLLIAGRCCCSCWPLCLFTAHVGCGSSPSPVLFSSFRHSHKLSSSWLLGMHSCSCRSLSVQARPVYLQFQEGFPSPLQHSVPHPLCNVSLLFLLLITQVLLFPHVEVSLSRGLCRFGPGLSVGVPHTTKLTLSASSQAVWARATVGMVALLVSPFNVKWRFSAPAGGVEGSNFCLFSVVLLQGVSPASLQDFTIGGMLSASSL
jgi:hypothetical protein